MTDLGGNNCEGKSPSSCCGKYDYYKKHIDVWVGSCAFMNPRYSWAGLFCDRTPFGVIAHETGHHIDGYCTKKFKESVSAHLRNNTKEYPLTSYCPDKHEYFAEMMRLYITNPNLLRAIRPNTYKIFTEDFGLVSPNAVHTYEEILNAFEAPESIFNRVNKKIAEVSL